MKKKKHVIFSVKATSRLDKKGRPVTRWTALLMLCAAGSLLVLGLQSGTQASSVEPTVISAYESLREYISSLPTSTLQKGLRMSFVKKLENSQGAYGRGQPCTAAHILDAYLNHATALRTGRGMAVAEDLYNRGWTLLITLLTSLAEDEGCAGYPSFGAKPVITITESDNTRLTARLEFGAPVLRTVEAAGEVFTEITFPGFEAGGAFGGGEGVGAPGVPMTYRLVAFPIGSQPSVQVVGRIARSLPGVNLYPRQASPADQQVPDGELPPFTKDEEAYQQNRFFPQDAVSLQIVGKMRDLNVAQLAIAPSQYNPATQTLVINDQLDFEVQYVGGTGTFVTAQSLNPFERFNRVLDRALFLNHAVLDKYVSPAGVWRVFGEELLIITDPAFVDAANDLKQWKNEKGILTRVVQTGTGPGQAGTTADEIHAYVQYHYDHGLVRPSYLLLLGDADFIPPFYRSTWIGSPVTATDLDYSLLAGDDLLADIGVARIPVHSQAQAQLVVDKIINYEKHPVSSADFYKKAALAGYFECCSGEKDGTEPWFAKFIQTLEVIQDALVLKGYTVDRLYYSDTSYLPSYTGDPTPRYYWNGTDLPAAIGPTSGFEWNADFVDIINALNDGRFLVIHRDHGKPWGWRHPLLTKRDVAEEGLDNGDKLPVLFSVNCATGYFDDETVNAAIDAISDPIKRKEAADLESSRYGSFGDSLLEIMLRLQGRGVVGALGATRATPSSPNDALAKGFADALFPDLLPDYGGTESITRLADILNYGKGYVYSQPWGSPRCQDPSQGTGRACSSYNDSGDEAILFHAFGDPTLEVWTAQPLTLRKDFRLELPDFGERFFVFYSEEGATITAKQGEIPIGRAIVVNGKAELQYVVEPSPEEVIELYASKPGFVSTTLLNCYPALENPVIVGNGSQDYIGSDGKEYTRYLLGVTNRDVYPNDMFVLAPDLPPCGLNTNSSRSWVDIFDDEGQRRYGFCGLTSPADLANLWFAVPKGTSPPAGAYLEIVDRRCGNTYRSNTVPIVVQIPGITILEDSSGDLLLRNCNATYPSIPCSLPPLAPLSLPGYFDIKSARITQIGGGLVDLVIKVYEPIPATPPSQYGFISYFWQFEGGCVDPKPGNKDSISIVWKDWGGGTWESRAHWSVITDCDPRTTEIGDPVPFEFIEDGVKVRVPLDQLMTAADSGQPLLWHAGVRRIPFIYQPPGYPEFPHTAAVDYLPDVIEFLDCGLPPTPPCSWEPEDPAVWVPQFAPY